MDEEARHEYAKRYPTYQQFQRKRRARKPADIMADARDTRQCEAQAYLQIITQRFP